MARWHLKGVQATPQSKHVQNRTALLADVASWFDAEQDQVPHFGDLAGPQACAREMVTAGR
jgi:hypothetical protein